MKIEFEVEYRCTCNKDDSGAYTPWLSERSFRWIKQERIMLDTPNLAAVPSLLIALATKTMKESPAEVEAIKYDANNMFDKECRIVSQTFVGSRGVWVHFCYLHERDS